MESNGAGQQVLGDGIGHCCQPVYPHRHRWHHCSLCRLRSWLAGGSLHFLRFKTTCNTAQHKKMGKAVFCNSLRLAANPLFSPAGLTAEVTESEEPEPRPLGSVCSPLRHPRPQQQRAQPSAVLPWRGASRHLPAHRISWLCWEELE